MKPHHYVLMLLPPILGAAIGIGVYIGLQANRGGSWNWTDSLPFTVPGVFIGAIIGGSMVLGSLQRQRECLKSSEEVLAEIRRSAAAKAAAAEAASTEPVPATTAPTAKSVEVPAPGAAVPKVPEAAKPAGAAPAVPVGTPPARSPSGTVKAPPNLAELLAHCPPADKETTEFLDPEALKERVSRATAETEAKPEEDVEGVEDDLEEELRAALKAAEEMEKNKD